MQCRKPCGGRDNPRLFVYDLPVAYRVRGRNARDVDGKSFSFEGNPSRQLTLAWMYDVATIFYARALSYRCRVHTPQLADLFYVPAYNTEMCQHPSSFCAEQPRGPANHHNALYQRLHDQAGNALEAHGGVDHIFLTPRPGAWYFESHPLCELDLLDPRLGAAPRLSIEQRAPREDVNPFAYKAAAIFTSVPYPSWVRLDATALRQRRSRYSSRRDSVDTVPWRADHARPFRITGCFSILAGPPPVNELRRRLRSQCLNSPGECVYFTSSDRLVVVRGRRGRAGRASTSSSASPSTSPFASHSRAAALYWNSTFCLMPGGDSVTRKATMDALLLGCIPVFFHRGQIAQYSWHWSSWVANATVFVDWREILDNTTGMVEALRGISDARVRRMRATIAAHAHRMHWAMDDAPEADHAPEAADDPSAATMQVPCRGEEEQVQDAFTITLQALHARAADASVVEAGRRKQSTAGRAHALSLYSFVNVSRAMGALDGECRGSTGASDPQSCADNQSTPWKVPPHPLGRPNVASIKACIHLCERCARCRWVSYSLMLQHCKWHHSCDPGVNGSNLERRYEIWTYRSLRVKSSDGTSIVPVKL